MKEGNAARFHNGQHGRLYTSRSGSAEDRNRHVPHGSMASGGGSLGWPLTRDDAPQRPFCSQRCQMVDLAKWFNGEYCISESLDTSFDPPDPQAPDFTS